MDDETVEKVLSLVEAIAARASLMLIGEREKFLSEVREDYPTMLRAAGLTGDDVADATAQMDHLVRAYIEVARLRDS